MPVDDQDGRDQPLLSDSQFELEADLMWVYGCRAKVPRKDCPPARGFFGGEISHHQQALGRIRF